MNVRTLLIAGAVTALSTLAVIPAQATTTFAPSPCSYAPQSGDAVEKISGPGPELDRGYSLVGTPRAGTCVKVFRPSQDGRVSQTITVRAGDRTQVKKYAAGHSETRMAHAATGRCEVTIRVRIKHDNGRVGVYGANTTVAHCTLYTD